VDALAAFARVVDGVVDASDCVVDEIADVAVFEIELLVPVELESALVEILVESAEPDDGVSVDCDPLDITDVRPETLCAWVEVPFDP